MPSREVRLAAHGGAPSPATFVALASALGALLGFGVEVVFQPILYLRDARDAATELPIPWLALALVPLITAAFFGAVGLVSALPVAWLSRRRARPLAVGFVAFTLAVALSAHAIGLVVRYSSGLYPSLSTALLLVASPAQFHEHAIDSDPHVVHWLVAGLLGAFASVFVAFAFALRRAASAGRVPFAAPVSALAGVALLGAPDVSTALRDREVETAATALYVSMLDASAEEDAAADLPVSSLDGPLQREGAAYRARLRMRARAGAETFPNVLLIVLESVPLRHLGFGGYERPVSPNLDRLAARSLRLRRAWSTSTHSNYAQMAILSALLPRRGPVLDQYRRLDYPRAMPQDLLRPLGYDTATFSSQNEDWQGMRRFQRTPTPHHFFDSRSYRGPKMGKSAVSKVPDDATTSAAIEWLGRPRPGPFYMYLNLQTTHYSYVLPRAARRRFPGPGLAALRERGHVVNFLEIAPEARGPVRDAYDSALHFVDSQVGRVIAALEASGRLDDTLVVVTADHGESFGEAGVDTHGKSLREPEARPPLILHFPRRIEARDVDVPVSHVDVLPTVLDVLGLPPYPGHQGQSFLDEAAFARERRAVFLTMQGLRHADGIVCYPWKLVRDITRGRYELYHLGSDPGERRNLMLPRASVARRLAATLALQVRAQLEYHARSRLAPTDRFAPQIARCPELPES